LDEAQSQLIALSADMPAQPRLQVRVGDLFRAAREFRRALDHYRAALQLEARNKSSLLGAGEAAFTLEQYRDAQRFTQRLLALDSKNTRAQELLDLSTLIRELDPFMPRLSSRERASRVLAAYNQARKRLAGCATQLGESLNVAAPATELQLENSRLTELQPRMRVRLISRNPDLADTVIDEVQHTEEITARLCGNPVGRDRALLLIAQQREKASQ
jgi:tetratricopeptide (TPR) repeat protein